MQVVDATRVLDAQSGLQEWLRGAEVALLRLRLLLERGQALKDTRDRGRGGEGSLHASAPLPRDPPCVRITETPVPAAPGALTVRYINPRVKKVPQMKPTMRAP
jgi:hypothetical protein